MTEAEAIAAARAVAKEQRWTWIEPALAIYRTPHNGPATWDVFSNSQALGAKIRVKLADATGEVLEKGYIPR